jgi:Cdc6-like AAA superfamily ATPase
MTVHLTLQGKGGVGKTLTANMLAQHQKSKNVKLVCIDTDPVNRSFFNYKSLGVEYFNIMKNDNVDQALFDNLIERIIENKDNDFIIDNGASGFIPLTRYIIENDVIELLDDHGIDVNLHSVVTGGESMKDTLIGLSTLLDNIPNAQIYVWLNEFFGPIESGTKSFADMKIYKEYQSRIKGIVLIPHKGELFTKDMQYILAEKLTFEDAMSSKDVRVMSKSRLKKLQQIIFDNLDQVIDSSINLSGVNSE